MPHVVSCRLVWSRQPSAEYDNFPVSPADRQSYTNSHWKIMILMLLLPSSIQFAAQTDLRPIQ